MLLRRVKQWIARAPLIGPLAARLRWLLAGPFPGGRAYWEARYRRGGTSGAGSQGRLARFKAGVVNRFVAEHGVRSVVEFGCGDGDQVALARYPRYVGLDVSPKAVELCRRRFGDDPTKTFHVYDPPAFERDFAELRADLALSLDVIYHVVEADAYRLYMEHLFRAADRYVIVYSSDLDDDPPAPHIRHRRFAAWVAEHRPDWSLTGTSDPPKGDDGTISPCSFYFYEKADE